MKINEAFFECPNNHTNCSSQIGLSGDSNFYIFIIIPVSGFICSLILLLNICIKKQKYLKYNKKGSMKRLFQILPILDLISSLYWIISSTFFKTSEYIHDRKEFCAVISLLYLSLLTFYFCFMNFLLKHFRKISSNPIENILKTKTTIIFYIIISIIVGVGTGIIAYLFQIMGRSPLNTCFINVELSNLSFLILIIPLFFIFLISYEIIKAFRTSFIKNDEKIKKLYKKNAKYSLIFILLHFPLFFLLIFFGIFQQIDQELQRLLIFLTTLISCMIPLTVSVIRLLQGLARFELFYNFCCCKKKKITTSRQNRRYTIHRYSMDTNFSKQLSLTLNESEKFDWLDEHAIEFFMRDILIGIAYSIQQSIQYGDNLDESFESINYIEYNINFLNYNLNDDTIRHSNFLDVNITEYFPKTFAFLRKKDGINIDEMINSCLPMNNINGISKSQGKSDSFFISTDDNKYMIKTLKKDEFNLLKNSFLENYLNHIIENPTSLLCRLYGLYKLTLAPGDEFLIILMRNVIGDFKDNILKKYDIKGCTYGRTCLINDDNDIKKMVLKDGNFNEIEKKINLSPYDIEKFANIIEKDATFLKNQNVMDYSLFVIKIKLSDNEYKEIFDDFDTPKSLNMREENNDISKIILSEKNRQSACDISGGNIMISDFMDESEIRQKNYKYHDCNGYMNYIFNDNNNETFAYILSIIDYFQYFNCKKRLEYLYKTKIKMTDQNTISCVHPNVYSQRFKTFIKTAVGYTEDDKKRRKSRKSKKSVKVKNAVLFEKINDDFPNNTLTNKLNV